MSEVKDIIYVSQAEETHTNSQPVITEFNEEVSQPQSVTDSAYEKNMDMGLTPDVSIQDFLSRPVRIANIAWDPLVIVTVPETIYPITSYFQDAAVKRKVDNFSYISGDMHVKVVTTGTSFHYGRRIFSLEMWPDNVIPENLEQLPHVFADANTATGGVLTFPLAHYFNATPLNGYGTTFQRVAAMYWYDFNNLRVIGDSTGKLQISIFVWMTNVKLRMTTTNLSSQSGEHTLSNAAQPSTRNVVSTISNLARYTRASMAYMQKGLEIASLFGFSRPTVYPTEMRVLNVQTGNMPHCNVKDSTVKLALDSQNEVFVDPHVTGIGNDDDMQLLNIAKRPGIVAKFFWTATVPTDNALYRWSVTPVYMRGARDNAGLTMIPLTHVASCFRYWRGTIKYRIEVVCTPFHRGRLRVTYDPVNSMVSGAGLGNTNTTYSHIIDLSESTSYEFCAGWGVNSSYCFTPNFTTITHTGVPGHNLANPTFNNGYIAVSVISPITVGLGTTGASGATVEVNLWAYAGDDFSVAYPTTDAYIDREIYKSVQQYIPSTAPIMTTPLESQALQLSNIGSSTAEIQPVNTLCLNNVEENPDDGTISGTHMGENIVSLRQLLKRYTWFDTAIVTVPPTSGGSIYRTYLQTWNIPHMRGKVPATSFLPNNATTIGDYSFARNTFFNIFYQSFMGYRGGMRWKYLASAPESELEVLYHDVCNAMQSRWQFGNSLIGGSSDPAGVRLPNYQRYMNSFGNGGTFTSPRHLPTLEFETPYYNIQRFIPITRFFNSSTIDNAWRPNTHLYSIFFRGINDENPKYIDVNRYVAVADDFSFVNYKCAPVVYIRNIPD